MSTILTLCALLAGSLHIRAEYFGPRWHCYLFKPLTTLLILLLAVLSDQPVTGFYQRLVVVGLGFSLLGDILLMLPSDRFLLGLVSFWVAQLCYIVAFASQSHTWWPWPALPFLLLYGGVMLRLLWPYLGGLKLPVVLYLLVILLMGWQAYGQWQSGEPNRAGLALLGAILFIISDSLLAFDRFRQPFKAARLLVMSTYYAAQLLIAWSVAG